MLRQQHINCQKLTFPKNKMRQNRKLLSQLLIFLNVTSSQDTQEKWKEKH